jgi:hypothetical protein
MVVKKKKLGKQEVIVNDDAKLHQAFGVGDVVCQGDLLIVGIATLPYSAKPRSRRQLADGATQGSRHVLERGEVYDADPAEVAARIESATKRLVGVQYIGPVFVSPDAPTCDDLTHPEHGNQGFPSGMICAVVFQRSLDAEERERRVVD